MNGIEDGDKVLLTQTVDIIANDKFEAPESTCNYLLALVLKRLANSYNNDSPAFILDLLATGLDYLFKTFDHRKFVRIMSAF